MRVFLGITGASGAPYARRLLDALAAADCELGVSVSGAAIEVLATELYNDARLSRDETLARFTEGTGDNVTCAVLRMLGRTPLAEPPKGWLGRLRRVLRQP